MATCINYGSLTNGACECPTGLGCAADRYESIHELHLNVLSINSGQNCSSILCGDPIATPSNRTQLSSAAGNTGCEGTSQCSSGFDGLDCNICTSNDACSAVVSAYGRSTGNISQSSLSGLGDSDSVVCSTSPYTYTSGFTQCDVVNPTLQAVFPGTTTLKFQKNVRPSLALSDAYGGDNTTFAQLWYSSSASTFPEEQFYCSADSCTQANDTTTAQTTWSCSNLQCTCVPGATFCSGSLNLSPVLNGLSGTLDIDCDNDGGSCNFKQQTLISLFGQNGLGLTGCTFGECVTSSTIAQFSAAGTSSDDGDGLSAGVIAGLAVLGVILLAVVALFVLGFIAQKKAKQGSRKHLEDITPAGLSWSDISYALPSSKGHAVTGIFQRKNAGILARSQSAKDLVAHEKEAETSHRSTGAGGKVILDGISGTLSYGGFMAILGPSGAGKSTLVDILAGKRKLGKVSGSVEILATEAAATQAVRIGYVDQADVLPSNLTVREALMFAANLRLPESISRSEKEERVWELLGQLGLRDIADSRIGSGERRGISGGERRRLSIGLELVARPSILILDEPTSGLDSVSATRVVQVLQQLRASGRAEKTTVIATIHQPSSQIFHAFDSVLLLSSHGTQVYFGSAREATSHFSGLGYPCPHDWNPADHLLELASSPVTVASMSGNGKTTGQVDPSTFEDGLMPVASERGSVGTKLSDSDRYPPLASSTAVKRRNAKPAVTHLTQLQVLSGREFLNLKRDWSLIVMHNAVAAIVGLFVGGLYFHVDTTISGFQNRIGSLFFLGALIAFSALSALSNLLVVRALFLRERASTYYGPVMWMFSRVVWDIVPLHILPTLVLGIITYWMVGLSPVAANFFKFLLILVEFTAAITLWNLLLAVLIPQSGVAILVSNVINLAMLAYAGFFVNLSKIPAVLRWIQWLNPLKYALEALAVNEVSGGLLINDTLSGVKVQVNAQLIMELLFGFRPSAYYRDVLVLFAWIAGFGSLLILSVLRLREVR